MKTITRKMSLVATIAALTMLGMAGTASAAWLQNGIWVSNVCRAPSGAYWVYPTQMAAPVGTGCTIYATGEYGVVTAR